MPSLHEQLRALDTTLDQPEEKRGWGGFLLASLREHGAVVPDHDDPSSELSEYDCERMEPSPEWGDAETAWFWRVKARAFRQDYSDSMLNVTADSYALALPWFWEHEPDLALTMCADRLRARSYASWSPEPTSIDQLLDAATAPSWDLVRRICEILLRSWPEVDRNDRLLSITQQALAAHPSAPGRGHVLHARAHALAYGTSPDLQQARALWEEALKEEDGDFYGEVTTRRTQDRKARITRELARLDMLAGHVSMAIDAHIRVLSAEPQLYTVTNEVRQRLRSFREDDVPLPARREFLGAVLREVVTPRLATLTDESREQMEKLLELTDYHLADVGGGHSDAELLATVRSHPGQQAAAQRLSARAAARLAERRSPDSPESKLFASIFGSDEKTKGPLALCQEAIDARLKSTRVVRRHGIRQDGENYTMQVYLSVWTAELPAEGADIDEAVAAIRETVRDHLTASIHIEPVTLALGTGISDPRGQIHEPQRDIHVKMSLL